MTTSSVRLTLWSLSENQDKVLLTAQMFAGPSNFSALHTVSPPTGLPTPEETATYLSDVARRS